jgi:adenylate cyclase
MFAGGYTGLAAALDRAGFVFQTRNLTEAQSAEEAMARRAVALDGADAEARSRLAIALHSRGDHQGALVEAERALATSPNLADAHGALGVVLTFSGRPKEGLSALKTCIRLDPRAPFLAFRLIQIAIALYFCCEYAAAVDAAQQAIRSLPDHFRPYGILAAALGQMGQIVEANEALEKAIEIAPDRLENLVRGRYRALRPEDHAHMLEGLRKAGWQG